MSGGSGEELARIQHTVGAHCGKRTGINEHEICQLEADVRAYIHATGELPLLSLLRRIDDDDDYDVDGGGGGGERDPKGRGRGFFRRKISSHCGETEMLCGTPCTARGRRRAKG